MKLLTLSDLKHFWTNAVQKIPIKISDLQDDVDMLTSHEDLHLEDLPNESPNIRFINNSPQITWNDYVYHDPATTLISGPSYEFDDETSLTSKSKIGYTNSSNSQNTIEHIYGQTYGATKSFFTMKYYYGSNEKNTEEDESCTINSSLVFTLNPNYSSAGTDTYYDESNAYSDVSPNNTNYHLGVFRPFNSLHVNDIYCDNINQISFNGVLQALTSFGTHTEDTDIHVTTADKTKWNNGVSQSYVLRYSSASVTDNSTIAYSTLDNTDNIKTGDRVIDVDGKIFSVVSVDTANQTVTVGSALIDLALDGNVVHTSGNETVGGIKSFSDDTYIKSLNFTNEVASTSSSSSAIMPLVSTVTYTDQTASKSARINLRITASGDKSLYPHENNQYSLGLTSRKWSEVHGMTYYYGSSDVEFSTKFVTTDTAQTISGVKTFSSSPLIYNSDTTASIPQITLKNQKVVKSSTTETGAQLIYFTDKNNNALGQIETRVVSNGTTGINITSFGLDSNNQNISSGVQILRSSTTANFAPNADNAVTCGRALAKWSDVQTYKVNNLMPSSLSLPSTRDNAIDISSYFTGFNNGDTNNYTPTVNGWIFLDTSGCNALHCFCMTTNNLTHYGSTIARASDGLAYITFPVLANTVFKCTWYTNSTITLNKAWFIPCQGNV